MAKHTETSRTSAAFALARLALIHILAKNKVKTEDIADMLGCNRSYVIRLQELDLTPANDAEIAIAKLANRNEASLRKMGFGFLFGGGFTTTLAGGERAKPGPKPKARPAAPPKPPKAAKAPAKGKAPKPPKAAKAPAKVAKGRGKGKPKAAPPVPAQPTLELAGAASA